MLLYKNGIMYYTEYSHALVLAGAAFGRVFGAASCRIRTATHKKKDRISGRLP